MSADQNEIIEVEKRLRSSTRALHKLAASVGHAKQVREFTVDRKKNALAKYVVRALKAGQSATAAEAIGRADPAFGAEMEAIAREHEAAETTIAQWIAEQASFEAARSLLSMAKETFKTLEG